MYECKPTRSERLYCLFHYNLHKRVHAQKANKQAAYIHSAQHTHRRPIFLSVVYPPFSRGRTKKEQTESDALTTSATSDEKQRKWGWMEPALQTWKGASNSGSSDNIVDADCNDKATKMTMSATTHSQSRTHCITTIMKQNKFVKRSASSVQCSFFQKKNCHMLQQSQRDLHQFFQSLNTFGTNKN